MKAILCAFSFLLLGASAWAVPNATLTVTNTIGPVAPGGVLTVDYSVQNTGDTTQIFQIGAQITQGATTNQIGQASTATLAPGASGAAAITYTVPTDLATGQWTLHSVVWSGPPGTPGDYLSAPPDQDFTVAVVIQASVSISPIPTVRLRGRLLTLYAGDNPKGNRSYTLGKAFDLGLSCPGIKNCPSPSLHLPRQ